MIHRLLKPSLSQSFFIFGPRGSGKTTFLKDFFKDKIHLWIDLLNVEEEDRYALDPGLFHRQLTAPENHYDWVVVDEIQKNPRLLDSVHRLIENTSLKFALTGSSARKLKQGSANLLAGRAFINHLFPLTRIEMGKTFNLMDVLHWGTLPSLMKFSDEQDKKDYLKSYALTYLKEEIWAEHIIRELEPFRKFLPIAAQSNGEILNYSKIARDVGVDYKTIQSYFQILEDTLVGFMVESFHHSVRKQQHQAPKFYFFDTGVKRALENSLNVPLQPQTYMFGKAFEHWIITEIHRLNHYTKTDLRLYYIRTKDNAEIDLIVERFGKPTILLEIKSGNRCDPLDAKKLERFLENFPGAIAILASLDPHPQQMGFVQALPWEQALDLIFADSTPSLKGRGKKEKEIYTQIVISP
ncbi:MAG: hypothetical protein A3G32_05295 [Deltaproteobacteria bacterium RIFCSPLOWO2_12_FULL_40_28]|nr:MAG: hypothetical protein A3C45_09405 [Deltaproteobacteria bacterium RIFCSPHIGHO2_02_FULL_40_28]OGQ19776.1 MAG: hypothetical protein A3E27_08600 [Deltaproteobacteria bacterium RIFCSPHIGHO2_12_FULL_40_32]OGQ41053.1 MAG: hypothetical protein A3I69_04015 [Deltaproteobacteria bacterium RIFCSPLOWO2_02_FULL_40_36]OGQ54169.1 MAG: hypothetical protein A3G32_05295 [Deltaproteobacteria bacterium RIFCSPLOWO2_12_FULL_40_28]